MWGKWYMCRQGILICRRGWAPLTSGLTTCTAPHFTLYRCTIWYTLQIPHCSAFSQSIGTHFRTDDKQQEYKGLYIATTIHSQSLEDAKARYYTTKTRLEKYYQENYTFGKTHVGYQNLTDGAHSFWKIYDVSWSMVAMVQRHRHVKCDQRTDGPNNRLITWKWTHRWTRQSA